MKLNSTASGNAPISVLGQAERGAPRIDEPFKRPILEIPKFSGSVDNRLTRLLNFLRIEVESEERINMAMSGFAIRSEIRKKKTREESKDKTSAPEVSTGRVLLTNEDRRKKCVFCNGNHENAACEKAKMFSYDVIRNIIRENNCCFKCLKNGHVARKCRVKLNCSKCSKHHSTLVCQGIF